MTVFPACGVSDGPVKRKACKNCTCGLAEQLDADSQQQTAKTSSCGNVTKCFNSDNNHDDDDDDDIQSTPFTNWIDIYTYLYTHTQKHCISTKT